jgi:hypothetical protein
MCTNQQTRMRQTLDMGLNLGYYVGTNLLYAEKYSGRT